MAPKLVYVAGPFRAPHNYQVHENIERARKVATDLALQGFLPVCVHTMQGLPMHGLPGVTDAFWLKGTLELMRRCDAVVIYAGWWKSEGTVGEVNEAFLLGIPVYMHSDFGFAPIKVLDVSGSTVQFAHISEELKP